MRLQLAKIALIFGGIGGLLCALFSLTIYWLDAPKLLAARSSDFWISAVCILFALFYVRKNRQNGELLFSEALMIATMLSLFLSIVSATITSIYILMDSNWLATYIEQSLHYVEKFKEFTIEKYGKEGYEQQVLDAKGITNSSIWLDEFLRKLFVSFILCPILALVMRKKAIETAA